MANGNGNGSIKTTMVISSGVLIAVGTIMVNMFMAVQKDTAIALDVARQHGSEFVAVREEMSLLRESLRDMTSDRYKGKDAERDLGYITDRLNRIEADLKKHYDSAH